MNRFWPSFLLLFAACLTLSCGSENSRQLQSITVTQTQNGSQFQLVASGTFSSDPVTVSPLPVNWTNGLMAPPPPTYNYTLTAEPYVFNCASSGPIVIVAFAPRDPSAPSRGSVKTVIQGNAEINCP